MSYVKRLLNAGSQRFTAMFSSKSFIVLGLVCRSLIQFELIFAYGVMVEFQLLSFTSGCLVVPAPFVKRYSLTKDDLGTLVNLFFLPYLCHFFTFFLAVSLVLFCFAFSGFFN